MDGGTEILRTEQNKSLIRNGPGKPAVFLSENQMLSKVAYLSRSSGINAECYNKENIKHEKARLI